MKHFYRVIDSNTFNNTFCRNKNKTDYNYSVCDNNLQSEYFYCNGYRKNIAQHPDYKNLKHSINFIWILNT